jgi:hypothetical protein
MTHVLWPRLQNFCGRVFVVWEWPIPLAAPYIFLWESVVVRQQVLSQSWLGVLMWEPESPLAVSRNFLVGGFPSIHLDSIANQHDADGYRNAAAVAAQNIVGDKSSKPTST